MGATSPVILILSVFFLTHSPITAMYIYAETGADGLSGLAQIHTSDHDGTENGHYGEGRKRRQPPNDGL